MTAVEAALFVGLDWAQVEHAVCVMAPDGSVAKEFAVRHHPEGLGALCDELTERVDGRVETAFVAIEVPHGPVVEALMERGFSVYAINPKQLDRFRDRFSPAGAKDDRLDARVLADSLRTDRHRFRQVEPQHPTVIELREWSRMADDLREEQVRLGNRLRHQLQRYYPQALELGGDIARDWFLDLLELAPTPDAARRLRLSSVREMLAKHRIRRLSAEDTLATLRKPGFRVAAGTVEAATAHIALVSDRLRVVARQRKRCNAQLERLCGELQDLGESDDDERSEQHDVDILLSLPGVGRIVLAVLLSEASRPLHERDYHALRALTGVAPVTRRSGKKLLVVMRTACNSRLKNAAYHWARVAVQRDPVWKARYAALRSRGQRHGRALRSVADRLLNVACAMLRNQTLYEPSRLKASAAQEAA